MFILGKNLSALTKTQASHFSFLSPLPPLYVAYYYHVFIRKKLDWIKIICSAYQHGYK